DFFRGATNRGNYSRIKVQWLPYNRRKGSSPRLTLLCPPWREKERRGAVTERSSVSPPRRGQKYRERCARVLERREADLPAAGAVGAAQSACLEDASFTACARC